MKVVTRFAPTISGDLHIGGLYNALVNYLFAKRYDGDFKLRLDGIFTNDDRLQWQKSLEEDLITFGLIPDEVLRCSDRLEYYKTTATSMLLDHPRSYYCDCTVQDLLKRADKSDVGFYHLYRPEKYPPYCKIAQIKLFGLENDNNIAVGCGVKSGTTSQNSSIECLTGHTANKNKYWEPVDSGYAFHPMKPEVTIHFKEATDVSGIEIVWRDRPIQEYKVEVCTEGKGSQEVVHCSKPGRHFVDHKPGQPYPTLTSDKQSFAAVKGTYVRITFIGCPRPVDRPYFYDYHCRDLGKSLDLTERDATMRMKNKDWYEGGYSGPVDFLTQESTIQPEDLNVDTCWWFGRAPDLVFTSPLDDHDLGVTHLLRGEDIQPFSVIESQIAEAMGMLVKPQLYHGMIIDTSGYKYSKFVESTPVRQHLKDGITADMILTYLAHRTGLVESLDKIMTPKQLVQCFEASSILTQNIVIDEEIMIEVIKERFIRS